MQPTLPSSPKIRSATSINFHLNIPTLLIHKIILTMHTHNPSHYTPAISHLPLFPYNRPNNLPQSMDSDNTAHNQWIFVAQTHKIGLLQVWQTIQSTFFHTLKLWFLLPYPTNTIAGTHILLETSCLIWSLS